MQRHLTPAAALGGINAEHPFAEVNIAAVHSQRLTDPQAGAAEQTDRRFGARGSQRRRERPGRGHQRRDLLRRVDVRRQAPLALSGQQIV